MVPAHAGVVPPASVPAAAGTDGPRARGGGPSHIGATAISMPWSPRTRGWSPATPRRHPHRGDGPRHAGWSRREDQARGHRGVVPAHAGWSQVHAHALVSGQVVPAHAGVVPATRSPSPPRCRGLRARGDGPVLGTVSEIFKAWSPRTRGWSRHRDLQPPVARVVPAHAGVVPTSGRTTCVGGHGPRERGDAISTKLGSCRSRPLGGWRPLDSVRPITTPRGESGRTCLTTSRHGTDTAPVSSRHDHAIC